MSILGTLFGHRTTKAASGSLLPSEWQRACISITLNLRAMFGADVVAYTVANTNSMLPTFDANAILLAEKVPFESLREGDIVTRHSANGLIIVHRLNEREGSNWWPLGDGNGVMDNELVTPANFDRRVCGILYGAKDAATDK